MKNQNQIPVSIDWKRYDSPTVLRRHGREFLDRMWAISNGADPDAVTRRRPFSVAGRRDCRPESTEERT